MPPCDWPTVPCSDAPPTDVTEGGLDEPLADGSTRREQLTNFAVELLWRWTGRYFGTCPVEVRPCREDCARPSSWRALRLPSMYGTAHEWVTGGWCGSCGPRGCACTRVPALELPGPVAAIVEVWDDGTQLDPATYRLEGDRLLRIDGGTWPACQDMLVGPEEAGALAVRYDRGVAVPSGGQVAAGVLACNLWKGAIGQPCDLPERVQTITRQGVTMALLDAFDDLAQGRTGIWAVDSWVASITQPPPRAVVWSPDLKRTGRRVPVQPYDDTIVPFTTPTPGHGHPIPTAGSADVPPTPLGRTREDPHG